MKRWVRLSAVVFFDRENVGGCSRKRCRRRRIFGAVAGGAGCYGSGEARSEIMSDLRRKSLENKAVAPKGLANGFLFFPGEAHSARQLRLQPVEEDTGRVFNLKLNSYPES